MSGIKAKAGAKGVKDMVGAGGFGFGGNADSGLGGRTDDWGGRYGRDGDGYGDGRIIKWEDTVANITL